MFRYERPQKGRQRQFHQIGVELLGVAGPPAMSKSSRCGAAILRRARLPRSHGARAQHAGRWREPRGLSRRAGRLFQVASATKLSADSRERLERNPLRILDSKDEGDRALVAEAPRFGDHLNQTSRDFFAAVTGGLEALGIAYQLNPRLVRGLDYYCHTAFEFTTDALGAQGTVHGRRAL